MKPAPFEYAAPESLDDALALLDDDSRPLAGGQSLVPMLNFRLARPARLVDLERVAGLRAWTPTATPLRIGAMTRQATLERSQLVAQRWPLLRQAVRLVGHAADPLARHRRRLGRARRPEGRAAGGAGRARRALPRALGDRRAHADAPTSCSRGR